VMGMLGAARIVCVVRIAGVVRVVRAEVATTKTKELESIERK
jgi:hypothetical protein